MINKIKYLFLSAICIGFIGEAVNIPAQICKNKILVAGKSPLERSNTKKSMGFHEWIFDTELTFTERRKFQSFAGIEHRRSPVVMRRNMDEIMETLAQVCALNAEKQQRARELTISKYLDDLRRADNENDSQFLLDMYKRTQRQRQRRKRRHECAGQERLVTAKTKDFLRKTIKFYSRIDEKKPLERTIIWLR